MIDTTFAFRETRIAWCAGLFEGEGSIFKVKQPRRGQDYYYVRATLKMTDLDVVEKFHGFVECGTIIHQSDTGVKNQPKHWKKHYYWQLSNREQISNLMILFWPYLGQRRRNKILELEILKPE